MSTKSLGNSIKARRKGLGMSQSDLALVSSVGRRFIGDLESGKDTCVLGKTLQVLDSLGLDINLTPRAGG